MASVRGVTVVSHQQHSVVRIEQDDPGGQPPPPSAHRGCREPGAAHVPDLIMLLIVPGNQGHASQRLTG